MSENEKKSKDDEEFAFIKEKIKDKPLSKKRVLLHCVYAALMAVVFGVVACLVFTIMQPMMGKWFAKEEDNRVVIPADEYEALQEDTELPTEIPAEEDADTEPVYITETQELEPEDYQTLQKKLYAIGETANHSIVTVTGVRSDTDWFNSTYNSEDKESGVIVANNGTELLIMTERKVIADAETVTVTFVDGDIANAAIKKYDGSTGIAILSVPVADLSEHTLSSIQAATLGNSLSMSKGTVVLALGSPLGTNFSILSGNITSVDGIVPVADADYTIFETDIVGNSSGSGVLINLSGEVVGLVMQEYSSGRNTLAAVSISELKTVIETLSNGGDVPYLGLYVSTVTDDIAEQYDLPTGVYINSIDMDSPAMTASLLSGDIIVEMDGKDISDVEDYMTALQEHAPGSEVRIVVKRLGSDGYTKISCNATAGVLQ